MSWDRLWRALFDRPYLGLPSAVVLFFVLSFALHPSSPFYTHHLSDPDDYMRLQEVSAWLHGQSWYDLSVSRLSPGANTVVHWSRLIDLPIAFVALPFVKFMGSGAALLIASFIVPLIWFGVALKVLTLLARYVMGRDESRQASLFVLFMPLLLFNYTPGRVDHHGVQAVIACFGLIVLCRIIDDANAQLFSFFASAALAAGFWIGAEALPWAILSMFSLVVIASVVGQTAAKSAAFFTLGLTFFTALFIGVALPPSAWSSLALSWFSSAYLIFSALCAVVFIIVFWAGRFVKSPLGRFLMYGVLGLAAAATFFMIIPSAWHGPFADYDVFDATTALDNIGEAQPLRLSFHANPFMPLTFVAPILLFLKVLFLPLIALGFSFSSLKKSKGQEKLIWAVQALFLSAALLLTLFWQMRVGIFMEIFAVIPLAQTFCVWVRRLQWRFDGRRLFVAELAAFMILGFLPTVLLPALANELPLYPDIILFPAARPAALCPLEPVIEVLNDKSQLGAAPHTIMNTSDSGPQILFATQHNVVAGNFDVPGNADAYTFFSTTSPETALQAARTWKADLVLVCRKAPILYLGQDYYKLAHTRLQKGPDGLLHFANIDRQQPFISKLIKGDVPSWLKPIEIPFQSDYLLYSIQSPSGTP